MCVMGMTRTVTFADRRQVLMFNGFMDTACQSNHSNNKQNKANKNPKETEENEICLV